MAGGIIAPVLMLIRDGLRVESTSIAFVITTHAIFVAIFSPVVGFLIDRIGTKKLYVAGLVLYGLAGGAGMVISSYWLLIVSRALLGLAVAAIVNPITVMILNFYEGPRRDQVMGWRASANSFGGILWPLIGGALGNISWRLPFAVYLMALPFALFALLAVSETHQGRIEPRRKQVSAWRIVRMNPTLFFLFGLMFWGMVLLYAVVVFIPQVLEGIGVTNPFKISAFMSVMGMAAGLTGLLYQRIRARFSYKSILLIAFALWGVALTAMSQIPAPALIVASVACVGMAQGLVFPLVMVWSGELVDIADRGRILSFIGTFSLLGQFFSPVLLGQAFNFYGIEGVYLFPGVICAVLFFVLLFAMSADREGRS